MPEIRGFWNACRVNVHWTLFKQLLGADHTSVRCQRFATVCSNSPCPCSYSKRRASNAASLLSLGLVKTRGISALAVCSGHCKIHWRARSRCAAKRRQTRATGSASSVAPKFKINGNVSFGRCEKPTADPVAHPIRGY